MEVRVQAARCGMHEPGLPAQSFPPTRTVHHDQPQRRLEVPARRQRLGCSPQLHPWPPLPAHQYLLGAEGGLQAPLPTPCMRARLHEQQQPPQGLEGVHAAARGQRRHQLQRDAAQRV